MRPWSSAVRFGAQGGDLWFKVNGAGTRHEGSLVAVLAELEPALVPPVLAVDPGRGWSLSRDAGPVMRSIAPPEELWGWWEAVLVRYAEAQIRLSPHRGAVLATGMPEVAPTTMPGQLRALVDELGSLPAEEGGLTAAEVEKLVAAFDEYDACCDELASSGVPTTLQHDDLHSSNICWGGSAESARIIDWGDASWGFPLATMLCTLNSLAWHAKCELDDPRVVRARDAYLEPFTEYAGRAGPGEVRRPRSSYRMCCPGTVVPRGAAGRAARHPQGPGLPGPGVAARAVRALTTGRRIRPTVTA